jgi:hypothetical protein
MKSISINDWLKMSWALTPKRCKHCHRVKSVAWWRQPDSKAGQAWWTWCPECVPLNSLSAKHPGLVAWIGEVRPTVDEAHTPRVVGGCYLGPPPRLAIWMLPEYPITTDDISSVMSSFNQLSHARETHAHKPGEWALELRDDGKLWAPWCPINWHYSPRRGDPLPYRETKLAVSKRDRACVSCRAPLAAGAKVWRPYKPGGTVRDADWSVDAHHHACVCEPCARKAIMKGVPANDGGTVYGPLRVVGKDTTG